MISRFLAVAGAGILLLAGCSSVPTRVDKGPVKASTYSIMESKAPQGVGTNERRAESHKEIQQSIASELEKRGLKQVAEGGDVQVGYLVIVANNATTAAFDEYFGYGDEASALSEKAHAALAKKPSRNYFEVGALVIDVMDPKDSKLLYRSYVVTDVQNLTPANRSERINMLIASCLGNLKISK